MPETTEFKFRVYSDEFKSFELDKDYYTEGILYLSGVHDTHPNKYGSFDMATPECISDMLVQVKGQSVDTVFKVGEDHEQIISDSRLVPKSKIVDAWIDGNKIIIKSQLNKHHPDFNNVWGSITGKYLDAHSMEFQPVKWKETTINGKPTRVLERIKVSGATYTGRPVSESCKLTDFYCKSLAFKITEESKMSLEDDLKAKKKDEKDMKDEEDETEEDKKKKKDCKEKKSLAESEEHKAQVIDEMKAIDKLKAENAELKSLIAKEKAIQDEIKSTIPALIKEEIKNLQPEQKVIIPQEMKATPVKLEELVGSLVYGKFAK